MKENICKLSHQEGINFLNIQTAYVVQHQKNKQANLKKKKKSTEDLNRHFYKEDIQMIKCTGKDAQCQ